jgi:hypothetical protein
VYPSIEYKLVQSLISYLAAYRIEAGNGHRFGRIVYNKIHPGGLFQCPDIAALTPDDTPFHFVVRQRHNGHRRFDRMFRGASLDGFYDNLLSFLVGVADCFVTYILGDSR